MDYQIIIIYQSAVRKVRVRVRNEQINGNLTENINFFNVYACAFPELLLRFGGEKGWYPEWSLYMYNIRPKTSHRKILKGTRCFNNHVLVKSCDDGIYPQKLNSLKLIKSLSTDFEESANHEISTSSDMTSQWETTLQCNVTSHSLNPYPKWSLYVTLQYPI